MQLPKRVTTLMASIALVALIVVAALLVPNGR